MNKTLKEIAEEWREVVGYEGTYEVSSLGRVRSLKSGAIMKPSVPIKRYPHLSLCLRGKRKDANIHRLVAMAFIPNPSNGEVVNHINGDKHDNRVENLEWCTQSENQQHAHDTGRFPIIRGEDFSWAKLTEAQVKRIRLIKEVSPRMFKTKIGKLFGVSRQTISYILSRQTWTHI